MACNNSRASGSHNLLVRFLPLLDLSQVQKRKSGPAITDTYLGSEIYKIFSKLRKYWPATRPLFGDRYWAELKV